MIETLNLFYAVFNVALDPARPLIGAVLGPRLCSINILL